MIQLPKNKKSIFIVAMVLVLGVVMTTLPDSQNKEESLNVNSAFDEMEYERELEDRLKRIIEHIEGVGSVEVMVTIEGSAISTYAQNMNENIDSDGDLKKETNIVMSSKSSNLKEAVISGYKMPEVKGAAVVCKNKLSAVTLEKIIGTVSASLGISTDKIYVTN